MKKILVIGMTTTYGGMESVVINYVRNIKNFQFDFLVHYKDKIAYEDELIELGSKIYRIPKKSKNYFAYFKELKKFFKEKSNEYFAIWVNSCHFINIDYYIYAKKYGIKNRIFHAHASNGKFKSRFRKYYSIIREKMNKLIQNKFVNIYWACSDDAAKYLFNKKIIKLKKYKIINNAIDISKFKFNEVIRNKYRKKFGIKKETIYGCVGRLENEKNHEFLIKVFNEIIKNDKNSKLFIIGDGSNKKKINELIKKYNLNKKIILLKTQKNIYDYYQMFDKFILPSLYEGLGIVLIEAQTSGCKCYASTGVSKMAKISNNLMFIDLKLSPRDWSKKITSDNINRNRDKAYLNTQKSGFDILVEAKKMEKDFERMYKNNVI